jgi:hypothetical protein
MWGGKGFPLPIYSVAHPLMIVNRWLSSRFNLLSSAIIGVVGLISVLTRIDASLAGFALAFASTITRDVSNTYSAVLFYILTFHLFAATVPGKCCSLALLNAGAFTAFL